MKLLSSFLINYIMGGIGGIAGIAAPPSAGLSATIVSVVRTIAAMLSAFCRAGDRRPIPAGAHSHDQREYTVCSEK